MKEIKTMKEYKEIIKNCQECPACYQPTGMGVYMCAKTGESLGYDDDFIAIPKHCPLKDWIDDMPKKVGE